MPRKTVNKSKPARRIEVVWKKPSEIKTNFGNPRKAKKKDLDELKRSLETLDDFGVLVIDEHDNIISGSQRLKKLLEIDPEKPTLCKQLFGYSEAEKRAINIKANEHSGEWDLDLLASWTADLGIGLDIKDGKNVSEHDVENMELIAFEKYDYVLIVCNNSLDYENLKSRLGIKTANMKVTEKKKIKARAVWFDDIQDRIK